MLDTVKILNCKVTKADTKETIVEIKEIIKKRQPVQHVVVNAGKLVMLQKDHKLKEIIEDCEIINADGQAVVWASKFLNKPLPERVAGIDLMYELIEVAAKENYSVYFLGAKEEVVTEVVKKFKKAHPTLNVAGYRNGYWRENEEKEVVASIRKTKADILLVAMSSPKKEYFLNENLVDLNVPFCMGVGGSFDVVAGYVKRAPKWMQKSGLEWLYRLLQEPKRMWKRYLIGNTLFVFYVCKEKFFKKSH